MINESIEESFIDEEKQIQFSENHPKNYRDLFSFQNFAEMYKKQRELVSIISQQQEAVDTMQKTIDRVLGANNTMQQTNENMKKEMEKLKNMIETKDILNHKAS